MSTQPTTVQKRETDVLIIGSGGAGLRAAIEATTRGANVLIIAKEELREAHTGWAMGGINVAIKEPATPQQHFEDTINGGWRINNFKLAKIFAEEMPDRIHDLERYGVLFDRLPDGTYFTWASGKQSAPLNLCAGDYTGREMMRGLLLEVKRLGVPYLEHTYATRLFKQGDRVVGAFLMNSLTGEQTVVRAKAVIVATGGGGAMYRVNTNAPSNTGEGYAWGLDMGAEMVDMELVQFHPTGMAWPPEKRGTLVTEKVRGNGGILKNKHGERFMARYQPQRMELAGRDEVSRAIYQEIQEGRGTEHNAVYLDVTHWEEGKVEKLIPDVFAAHMEVGIDIRKQMMEISPSMHHMMGGFVITEWGETNVEGLYAVGEVSCSVHGANRLGGNSIAEGQVFGRRAGIRTSEYVKGVSMPEISEQLINAELQRIHSYLQREQGPKPAEVLSKIKDTMWNYVGIIRTEEGLLKGQEEIKKLQQEAQQIKATNTQELQASLEIRDMLETAEAIVTSALVRKESRGAHFRADYPQMSEEWEKNIRVFRGEDGKLVTRVVPVTK
ncbi:thiol-driven fumarate reductase flavoprotein subunit [Thermosporothrix hazakensis]|jgi:succinate dehydrogenase/fumarate reductase flavoprotein subunit|uniref:Thiol-driven fumarate reductase flavoprotein subunit n=1 Tax=Thermosporothrix hazakensis TaxID=644383 RepID=A0A326UGL1_THEHA|nr:FAD-dependent oxidoreductase [Thermosporothrix hazakensis]PZW30530.1 thiol-driven fumarate reductase flavoprotein subunit [Thermosporothrix hazakensis]GCE49391.1 fumarate reductase subunit A [Thermosporothrix hazakensis]